MNKRMAVLLLILGARVACATSYYVDCNYGSNGNPGTSPQLAWRSLLQVGLFGSSPQNNGGVSFQPGDTINLLRDCTWNETLTPPSSGTNPATGGALIRIDSYGSGAAPHLTGYMPIATKWWTQVAGVPNVWAATLYSTTSGQSGVVQCGIRGFYCLTQAPTQLQYVRFGTVWGNSQTSQGAMTQDRDWWYDATNYILYVYSASGDPATHYGTVAPIVLSGQSLLNINGQSWLEIQHLQIDWFDGYGVQVGATAPATSDHIWLANIAANSMVENATTPLGFYVHPNGTPTDIHLYNTDANMNYAGYRFDGCSGGGCAFEIKNCRGYGNRAYGIVDNVGGSVNYDFCHLYGNNLATALTVDTSGTPGPTAGTNGVIHNIPAETPPWIRRWQRWPAYTTVTFDDPGLVQYSDSYVSGLLPIMASRHVPLSIAVVTGGSYSQSIIGEVQGWIEAGWDVNAHSISHEYWDPPASGCGDDTGSLLYAASATTIPCHAIAGLQYTGTVANTVSLMVSHTGGAGCPSNNCLIMNPTPYDQCAYHAWDLTPVAPGATAGANQIDTLGTVVASLPSSCFQTVTAGSQMSGAAVDELAKGAAKAYSLADVSIPDIKAMPVNLDFSESYLETQELGWAQSWMNLNFTGLPAKRVYVMPGTYGDAATETIAASLGYAGVRGTGSLKSTWVPGGADATLAKGYDVYNILSQGIVPNYQGLSYGQMRNRISQDLFKNALWGRPIGYFWHVNELRPDEVENFMDALAQGGATLKSNTQMVTYLLGCAANDQIPSAYVAGSFYVCPSNGVEADFRPTANSPVVGGAPLNLGAEYEYDLMGINRNLFAPGWAMPGAYAFVPEGVSATH
jgi:hypothetical protein